MPTDDLTDDLTDEQDHLAESREQLARMRARTASMDASAGGDWVSREFLKSTFALRMKQTNKASMCSTSIETAWLFLAIPMEFELPSLHPVKYQDLAFALSSATRGGAPS